MSRTRPHLPALDGLRGVGILLVILTHAVSGRDGQLLVSLGGWTAVDLFFVISGFLITGILLDAREEPHRWRNFVARRVLRIFPLYYGVLILMFVILPLVWPQPHVTELRADQPWYWLYGVNYLAVARAGEPWSALGTGHFWSLAIEEQFYLLWPLVVWACSSRTLVRVALGTMAAGFLFRCWLVLADPLHTPWASYVLIPAHTDGLMIGAALAVIARREGGLQRLGALAPAIGIAAVSALVTMAFARGGLMPNDGVVSVAGYPLVALVWAAVLVAALTRAGMRGCQHPWLLWIGKYSYGIYVFHLPIIAALRSLHVLSGQAAVSVALFTALATALSFSVAWLSYHLYEKRFLALKRYFDSGPVTRAAVPDRMVGSVVIE